jgi:F-type H+-transporting ATPase subunit epsilon
MHLRILLPSAVFADHDGVSSIAAETRDGSFGLLEHRLDCVAALGPGILTYEIKEGQKTYLAIDDGVLVKAGANVTVSVRQAIAGTDLSQLKEAVRRKFLTLDKQERSVRDAVVKMEGSFAARFAEFEHER